MIGGSNCIKCGDATSALYVTATVVGIIGGIVVDADVADQRDKKVVPDGSRIQNGCYWDTNCGIIA